MIEHWYHLGGFLHCCLNSTVIIKLKGHGYWQLMGKRKINVIIEQHGLPGNVGTNGEKKKR